MDALRDSALGQSVRYFTGSRYLPYPDERPGFQPPQGIRTHKDGSDIVTPEEGDSPENTVHTDKTTFDPNDSATQTAAESPSSNLGGSPLRPSSLQPTNCPPDPTQDGTTTPQAWCESPATSSRLRQNQPDEEASHPNRTTIILVDWYNDNDTENPQNWSTCKKVIVTAVLWFYTFTVYCASAIYTPSIEDVKKEFHVDHTLASLGLSLYVLGYGIGPLFFSPLSEISRIGRNPPYIITLFLFVLLAIPAVRVQSFAGFLVLRFLTGFLGSPCLATGGATLQDIYSSLKLPYGYTAWVGATFCAPALGPVISGFAVASNGWRLPMWQILWMALATFLIMFAVFPETSSANILLRRAQRIRVRMRDCRYVSQAELDDAQLSARQIAAQALIKPLQITLLDPAVFFTNFYSSYSYGVYYSFFEAFPLVYTDMYGFNLGLTGTAFLSIVIACLVGTLVYVSYVYFYLEPYIKKHGPGRQEHRLVPAIFASALQPVGLFLFAWTSQQSIHWIVSMIGIALFSTGGFVLFQGIFMYLPLSYPGYAASLFAANDFFRSAWAAGAVLYARPLFEGLGIARGVSLLGGLSCGGVIGVSLLYVYGAKLRARSKFAET